MEIVENTLIWFIGDNGNLSANYIAASWKVRDRRQMENEDKWHPRSIHTAVEGETHRRSRQVPSGRSSRRLSYAGCGCRQGPVPFDSMESICFPTPRIQSNRTRESIFMHYDPQWGSDYFHAPMPADRFIFDEMWKYYADGRFYQTSNDPEEQRDLSRAKLKREAKLAYDHLKNVFPKHNDGPLKEPYMNKPLKGVKSPNQTQIAGIDKCR